MVVMPRPLLMMLLVVMMLVNRVVFHVVMLRLVMMLVMHGMTNRLHYRVEPVVMIGRVLHNPFRAISLMQRVLSLHDISVAFLPVALVVSGFVVLNSVLELVLGMRVVIFVMVMLPVVMFWLMVLLVEASRGGRHCHKQ